MSETHTHKQASKVLGMRANKTSASNYPERIEQKKNVK